MSWKEISTSLLLVRQINFTTISVFFANKCDVLLDLVPFASFKKREKKLMEES